MVNLTNSRARSYNHTYGVRVIVNRLTLSLANDGFVEL